MLSAIRVASVLEGGIAVDGQLYRDATLAWLRGGDPWAVDIRGLYFAAPPPSLLLMLPFALPPAAIGLAVLALLGLVGTALALRRLDRPLWWLLFPPFVDGLLNANPHVLLLPLLVGGHAWTAPLVKAYAAPVLLLQGRVASVAAAALAVVITAPLLPWGRFVDQLPAIIETLRVQAGGRLETWAVPVLVAPALVALVTLGWKRGSWWAPVAFWPSTQYYYASLAMPAATPIAAMVLCAQFPGVTGVGLIVCAVELLVARRLGASERLVDWQPRRWRAEVGDSR